MSTISQLNDPDFDQPVNNSKRQSFITQLSAKSALIIGMAAGFMGLCTIGFFILLIVMLRK